MKKLLLCAAIAAFGAPAFANTLEHVVAKGIILEVQGMQIPITYAADGTLTGDVMGTTFGGKWRVDGTKFCTQTDFTPETCDEYPADKAPGDTFEITGADGSPVKITINK
jgi:hypothetical protein